MAEKAEPIRIHRIFTGEDGKSRMEEIEIDMEKLENGRGSVSKLLSGTGVIMRTAPPDMFSDWHVAQRRQLIATIAGEAELETGDGQVLHIKPGTIELVEDTTGVGHITRGRGVETLMYLFLPVDDQTLPG